MTINIMISNVGIRDPFDANTDKDGPILYGLSTIDSLPDLIYLIYTDTLDKTNNQMMKVHADRTKKKIEERYPTIKVETVCMKDSSVNFSPTDYALLTQKTEETFKSIAAKHSEKDKFSILIPSGTPQMKVAYILLKSRNTINAELLNIVEPRFVKENQEPKVEKVDIYFYRECILLEQLKTLLKRWLYVESKQLMKTLEENTQNAARKDVYKIFYQIFEAYHWEKASEQEYKKALTNINQSKKLLETAQSNFLSVENTSILIKLLKAQVNTLEKLKRDKKKAEDTYAFMFDLYYTAKRQYDNGLYITALSIIWRTYEGYLVQELKNIGIDINNKKDSRIIALIKETSKQYKKNKKSTTEYRNFKNYHALLEKYVNKEFYNELEKMGWTKVKRKYKRNDSIIGHGYKGVERDTVKPDLDRLKELCEYVDKDNFENYPFRTNIIEIYIKIIDDMILSIK